MSWRGAVQGWKQGEQLEGCCRGPVRDVVGVGSEGTGTWSEYWCIFKAEPTGFAPGLHMK